MMKRKSRVTIAVLLVISALLSMLSGAVSAAGTDGSTAEFEWTLENGILTIDGHGTPATFSSQNDQPWAAVRSQIMYVYIDDCCGLNPENIAYWFSGCRNLMSVELPASVKVIGYHAFYNCSSLQNIVMYHTEAPEIEQGAFTVSKPKIDHACGFDPFLHIDVQNEKVLNSLCKYDWLADGCVMTAECPVSMSKGGLLRGSGSETRAVGTCTECHETCSYTVDYEYWDSSEHTIRHWCSNCGKDQFGGVMWESHSFRNGICTKCGYNTNCSHPSTSRTTSGCYWYERCTVCGTILAQGEDHWFVAGDYEYVSDTQHRVKETCSRCGKTQYSYMSHDDWERIEQYSETQHRIYYWCDLCNHEVGDDELENHSFTNSAWVDYSDVEHRRQRTCSVCGYIKYQTDDHYDSNNDGYCDACGHQMFVRFSVTVPASLTIAMSETGQVFTADNAQIVNGSAAAVKVTGISVSGENGWNIVPFTEVMARSKVDSKQIGFKINNAATETAEGNTAVLTVSDGEWNIAAGASLALDYDAVVSATSAPVSDVQVLTVYFVIAWAS